MADLLLDTQTAPSTPAASKGILWADSTSKKPIYTADDGHHYGVISRNWSTASQAPAAATDVFITNSGLVIPSFGMQVGQHARWKIFVSKTAAGTVAAVLNLRIGSNQSTADTSRFSGTQTIAQSAAAVSGILFVDMSVRVVSASGVIVVGWGFTQTYGTTAGTQGFGSGTMAASSTFDNTALAGLFIGLSINTGTSAAWTIEQVEAELSG